MKRSEMLDYIKEDLLEKLKHRWLKRGETDKWAEFTSNQLPDMIEGFGMLAPQKEGEFCYKCGEAKDSLYWEPEND